MLPNLKALRTSKGLSQQKLADEIGTSQQAINRYENHNVEPDIDTLIKLADFFETTIDFLVGRRLTETQRTATYRLTRQEAELMDDYRLLNDRQQDVVRKLISSYKPLDS